MSDCLFYVFAAIAVAAALFMVSSRSAVNSAVGMIAALVAVAADYFLLDAPFLGVLQVLVYAGAVMVLFLFIIMLLDVDKASATKRSGAKWIKGALILTITASILYFAQVTSFYQSLINGLILLLVVGTPGAREYLLGLVRR